MTFSTTCPSGLHASRFGNVASEVQRSERLKSLVEETGMYEGECGVVHILQECYQQSWEDKEETSIYFGSETNEQPVTGLWLSRV